jgi:uncharacterized protein (TIGR03437 family)
MEFSDRISRIHNLPSALRLVKLALLCGCGWLALSAGLTGRSVGASSIAPPASHTGAPGEQTCGTAGCHNGGGAGGTLTLTGLPPIGYVLNEPYDVTVSLAQAGRARFGFEMTAIDSQGNPAGTWDNLEPSRIDIVPGFVGNKRRLYPGHKQAGTIPNGNGQSTWVLRWKAPAQNIGPVTFYVAGNAANGDGSTSGDSIYLLNRTVPLYVVAPQTVATVSAASFTQGALAGEAIVALFAAGGLAGTTVSASSVPLPTDLSGVQVRVKDAANVERDAPLFFVSPSQINFIVPAGTANGAAALTVWRDGTAVGAGTLTIEPVAPGLFTANANGQGVPAAVVLRVQANGSQSIEPVAVFNPGTAQQEPAPLDFGPESDRLFLILFGTGFRQRTVLANVTATIGGTAATVDFAGAQGGLAGLDQANLQLPRSLAGRQATLEVIFRVDGKTANTVQIAVK